MIDNISKEFERLFIIGRGCSKDFMYLMELRRLIFGLLHETKKPWLPSRKAIFKPYLKHYQRPYIPVYRKARSHC